MEFGRSANIMNRGLLQYNPKPMTNSNSNNRNSSNHSKTNPEEITNLVPILPPNNINSNHNNNNRKNPNNSNNKTDRIIPIKGEIVVVEETIVTTEMEAAEGVEIEVGEVDR